MVYLGGDKEAKIHFATLDALKLVDKYRVHIQVPGAEQWSKSLSRKYFVSKPFDWTFSTTYDGTLTGMLFYCCCLDSFCGLKFFDLFQLIELSFYFSLISVYFQYYVEFYYFIGLFAT